MPEQGFRSFFAQKHFSGAQHNETITDMKGSGVVGIF